MLKLWLIFGLLLWGLLSHGQNTRYADEIDRLYNANQRDSALMLLKEAIPHFKATNQYDSLAKMLRLKAVVYSAVKKPSEAIPVIDQSLEIAENYIGTQSYEYIQSLIIKGTITQQNYQLDEAAEILEEALRLLEQFKEDSTYTNYYDQLARTNSSLGWIYYLQRSYQDGIRHGKLAIDALLKETDSFDLAMTFPYQTLGSIYIYMSKYDSAAYYLERQYKTALKNHPPDHPNIGIALNGLASNYMNTGDYDKALVYFQEEEQIFYQDYLKHGNHRYLSVAYNNLSLLYTLLGDQNAALKYIRKSVAFGIKDYGENNLSHILGMTKLADILAKLGRFDEAKVWLERSYNIQNSIAPNDRGGMAFMQDQWASFYEKIEDWEQLKYYSQLTTDYYASEGIEHKLALFSLNSLAISHRHLGEVDSSWAYLDKAIEMSTRIFGSNHPSTHNCYFIKANTYYHIGEFQQSQAVLDQLLPGGGEQRKWSELPAMPVMFLIYTLQAKIYNEQLRIGEVEFEVVRELMDDFYLFFDRHAALHMEANSIQIMNRNLKQFYDVMIKMAFSQQQHLTAVQWVEFYKSNFLASILSNQLIQKSSEHADTSVTRLGDSLRKYSILLTEDTLDDPTLFRRYNEIKNNYRKAKSDQRESTFIKDSFQDYLSEFGVDQALLFYVGDTIVYRFHIQEKNIDGQVLKKDSLNYWIDQLLKYQHNSIEGLSRLYSYLIPDDLIGNSCVIVPDDKLFYLSFEALLAEDGRFLIESQRLHYAYSMNTLHLQHQLSEGRRDGTMISFTPGFTEQSKLIYQREGGAVLDSFYLYLLQQPFMLKVAEYLKALVPNEHITELEATEWAYKQITQGYDLIHLGTHGIIDDQSPLMSRLVFSKSPLDSVEDGYLHTYEIYNQRMDADLAILAACQTGQNYEDILGAEGIQSLAHAFTYAGCPSLVVSLWSIDEKVNAEILQSFYGYLAKGKSKAAALRTAKLDFLQNAPAELRDPSYWSGLILLGSDGSLPIGASRGISWWMMGVGVFVLGVLVWFYIRRRNTT